MGSIGTVPFFKPEVGVATANGRAYYKIALLLKRSSIPFDDIIIREEDLGDSRTSPLSTRLVITTRKERLKFLGSNVVCVEDLGDDEGLAREKLFSLLYPAKPGDRFVIGIDPGERTGVAAFINLREVESSVVQSMEETLRRIYALVDNAPDIAKIVKVGSGNLKIATRIAHNVHTRYGEIVRVQLVDESGTSALSKKSMKARPFLKSGTRDQRAAKLIAFREGQDYPG